MHIGYSFVRIICTQCNSAKFFYSSEQNMADSDIKSQKHCV